MLLRLSAVEATGRAAFALASVAVAITGHAAVGHGHCSFQQVIVATLGLLFAAWATRSPLRLLAAALLAQVVVHGGVPTEAHMLAIHTVASVLALGLMQHGEQLWQALARLLLPAVPRNARRPMAIAAAPIPAWRNSFERVVTITANPNRGPPVPA